MRNFVYTKAASTAEAVQLMDSFADSKFLGGGTNLIDLMRENIEQPDHLVDITALPLREIVTNGDGSITIGAAVKNSTMAAHSAIRNRFPVLSQAILFGASGQIRNMATV